MVDDFLACLFHLIENALKSINDCPSCMHSLTAQGTLKRYSALRACSGYELPCRLSGTGLRSLDVLAIAPPAFPRLPRSHGAQRRQQQDAAYVSAMFLPPAIHRC